MSRKQPGARNRLAVSLAAAAAAAGMMRSPSTARAGDGTWTYIGGPADYNNVANWNPNAIPTGNATIDNGGTVQIQSGDPTFALQNMFLGDSIGNGSVSMAGGNLTLTGTASATLNASLQLNASGGGSGTFNLGGGNVTVSGGNVTSTVVNVGAGTGIATLNISGGTFADTVNSGSNNDFTGYIFVGGGSITGTEGVGASGIGIINLSGTGVLTNSGQLDLGNGNGSVGTVNVGNGTTLTTNALRLGVAVTGSGSVYNSGGTITVNSGTNDVTNFNVGYGKAAYGYYSQTAGSLSVLGQIGVSSSFANSVGTYGGGVMSVSGGAAGAGAFLTMGRANTAGNGTITVSGSGYIYPGAAGSGNDTGSGSGGIRLDGIAGTGNYDVINVLGGELGNTSDSHGYIDLDYSAAGASNSTILNLDGGTTYTGMILASHAADNNALIQINFNGGTVRSLASNVSNNSSLTSFIGTTAGNATGSGIYVYGNGGTIDTNGNTLTITQALQAPAGSGVLTIPVTNGGSGYIGAPMIKISGQGATAIANMVPDVTGNGTYAIGSITITNPGVNYSSTPGITLIGGGPNATAAQLGTPTLGSSSSGSFTVLNNNSGSVTLSGNNSYGGNTTVFGGGSLNASYSTANSLAPIPSTSTLIDSGSTFSDSGNSTNAEVVNGVVLLPGGAQINETGSHALTLGNITRTVAGSTARFGPNSTASATAAGAISTTTANTNGILGGWAFFDGSGQSAPTTWAVGASSAGTPTAVSGLTSFNDTYGSGNDSMVDGSTNNDQDSGTDTVQFADVSTTRLNSLLINSSAGATISGAGAGTGTLSIISGGILIASGAGAVTIGPTGSLTSANGTDLIIGDFGGAATISLPVTGAIGFTKTGGSNVTLSGANTYTGITQINASTLLLSTSTGNNNIANSSAIRIQPGSTFDVTGVTNGFSLAPGQGLYGAGTVNGAITVSGNATASSVISAGYGTALGTSPGKLTITGTGMTWGASGVTSNNGYYTVKFAAPGASGIVQTGGTYETWDQITTSALTVSAGPNAVGGAAGAFTIAPVGNLTSVSNGTYAWPILQVSGNTSTTITIDGSATGNSTINNLLSTTSAFALDTSNFTVNGGSDSVALSQFGLYFESISGSNDLVLTYGASYNAAPEPGTVLLVMAGAGPMLLARRRRKIGVGGRFSLV